MVADYVIVGLLVFNTLLMLFCFFRLTQFVDLAIEDLDSKIAEAIRELVQGGLGDFEPVNPIQAALANMLTQKIEQAPIAEVISRDPGGKFT
tara:strand:- start:85 stop:360 length:276 start_codon:yes stop_codon:yes gene_type:complete